MTRAVVLEFRIGPTNKQIDAQNDYRKPSVHTLRAQKGLFYEFKPNFFSQYMYVVIMVVRYIQG